MNTTKLFIWDRIKPKNLYHLDEIPKIDHVAYYISSTDKKTTAIANKVLIGETEGTLSFRMSNYCSMNHPLTPFHQELKQSPHKFKVGIIGEEVPGLDPKTLEKIALLVCPEETINQRLGGGGGAKDSKKRKRLDGDDELIQKVKKACSETPNKKFPVKINPKTGKVSAAATISPNSKKKHNVLYAIRKVEGGEKTYYLGKTEKPCAARAAAHFSGVNGGPDKTLFHQYPFYKDMWDDSIEGKLDQWQFCIFLTEQDFQERQFGEPFDLSLIEKEGLKELKKHNAVYNRNKGGGGGVSATLQPEEVVRDVLTQTFEKDPEVLNYLMPALYPSKAKRTLTFSED